MNNKIAPRNCRRCGRFFIPKSPNQWYCTEECKKADYQEACEAADRAIASAQGIEYRWCAECRELFLPKSKKDLYCSEQCRRKARMRKANERHEWAISHGYKDTKPIAPQKERDGITWDEIRAVFAELKISSYQQAIDIIKERRRQNVD